MQGRQTWLIGCAAMALIGILHNGLRDAVSADSSSSSVSTSSPVIALTDLGCFALHLSKALVYSAGNLPAFLAIRDFFTGHAAAL